MPVDRFSFCNCHVFRSSRCPLPNQQPRWSTSNMCWCWDFYESNIFYSDFIKSWSSWYSNLLIKLMTKIKKNEIEIEIMFLHQLSQFLSRPCRSLDIFFSFLFSVHHCSTIKVILDFLRCDLCLMTRVFGYTHHSLPCIGIDGLDCNRISKTIERS